jgi:hypothetical protein
MLWARFAFVAVIVIPAAILAFFQIVDPGIGHAVIDAFTDIAHNITAILSAHPFEAVALGAFAVDPLDVTYTLAEWRALRRVSASTERRMRRLGVGPRLVALSPGRWGVTRRDDLSWAEAGGASGVALNAEPSAVKRNTGRDTRAATAASLAKRKATTTAPPAPVAAAE